MRLSETETRSLINVISYFIGNNFGELRLFGSRVKTEAKGGDIDLLLIVNDKNLLRNLLLNKHRILADIKNLIGEQKIDLKIILDQEIISDSFLKSIYPESLLLYKWNKNRK